MLRPDSWHAGRGDGGVYELVPERRPVAVVLRRLTGERLNTHVHRFQHKPVRTTLEGRRMRAKMHLTIVVQRMHWRAPFDPHIVHRYHDTLGPRLQVPHRNG